MRFSETIADLKRMGPISEDRKQTIELEEVAIYQGAYLVGETVKIYICDAQVSKIIDEAIKDVNNEKEEKNESI